MTTLQNIRRYTLLFLSSIAMLSLAKFIQCDVVDTDVIYLSILGMFLYAWLFIEMIFRRGLFFKTIVLRE